MATTLALVRSAREWMPSGFPGFTTISNELRAKITGVPSMSPDFCTVCMSPGEAEANTSAGAPCWIWVASVPDEPKLKATVVAGWMDRNVVASWVNAAVSEDAAETVIDPVRSDPDRGGGSRGRAPAGGEGQGHDGDHTDHQSGPADGA